MFRAIGRLFRSQTAVEKQLRNPTQDEIVHEASLIYARIPLRDVITEEHRVELSRELFLEINRICNARQPTVTCREKYAAAMLKLAAYQVLMIPAAPEADTTGLRGQPGITGELNAYLVELFRKNDQLRTALFAEQGVTDPADYQQLLLRLYWESVWVAETMNAARKALDDTPPEEDWHTLFLHAACVNAENGYRWDLELPPAFADDVARKASTAYSMFTDIVVSGAKNPAVEWRDYCQDSGIPMPDIAAK